MLGPSCGTWSIHLPGAALHTGPPFICVGMALLVGDQCRNIAAYRLAMIGRFTTILAGRIATISSVWCAPKPGDREAVVFFYDFCCARKDVNVAHCATGDGVYTTCTSQ